MDQQLNGGEWNTLGLFCFKQGTGGHVEIRNEGTNGYVTADGVRFSLPGQNDIILDNDSPTGVSINGLWLTSTGILGYIGANYAHDNNSGKGSKSLRYTPNIPVDGDWEVAMRWTSHPNRATNVPIEIVTNTGTTNLKANFAATSYTAPVSDDKIAIYPNPLRIDYLTIDIPETTSGTIKVFSFNGQLIKSEAFFNKKRIYISKEDFTKGLYIFEIYSGKRNSF